MPLQQVSSASVPVVLRTMSSKIAMQHFTAGMSYSSHLLPAKGAAAWELFDTAAGTFQQQCPAATQQQSPLLPAAMSSLAFLL